MAKSKRWNNVIWSHKFLTNLVFELPGLKLFSKIYSTKVYAPNNSSLKNLSLSDIACLKDC